MAKHAWNLFFCLIVLFIANHAYAAEPLNILRVTPTGQDVPDTRQIVVEFNRPVVPIGRMERTSQEVGIEITPPLNCQWRWLNTSSLSCQLGEKDAAVPATRYALTINPVIVAEDGGKIEAAQSYEFTTQRPAISSTSFRTWRSAQTPVIRVVFNQPVSKSSVAQSLSMIAGAEQYPLTVEADKEEQVLPDYLLMPGEKGWVQITADSRASDDQQTQMDGEEARRVWLVEPQKELPADKTIALHIKRGLVSVFGPEAGVEDADSVTFETFPEFAFVGVQCIGIVSGTQITVKPGEPQSELCNPLGSFSLAFTVPVLRSQVKDHAMFKPDLAGGKKNFNPWGEENRDWSQLGNAHQKDRLYTIWLPGGLKAAQSYHLSLPVAQKSMLGEMQEMIGYESGPMIGFTDEFGRSLTAPVEMDFATDHRKPNFEMPYHDVVLESKTDSEPPFYVNNLEEYSFYYDAVTAKDVRKDQVFSKKTEKIEDIQYALPMGVREMLGGKSGVVSGYVSAKDVVNKSPYDTRLFAQVTPWQAHVKLGHFSSLVWVTDLASGLPVPGVKVEIFKDTFSAFADMPKVIDVSAVTDENGLVTLPGSAVLDPLQEILGGWEDEKPRFFVRLGKDEDMALLPLSGAYNLYTWNFTEDGTYSSNEDQFGHMKSWGFTAQGIYRAGDTMEYKIYLRDQNDRTLTAPPKNGAYTLQIIDPLGKTAEEIKDITFSDFGAYASTYKIPETAVTGWYDFRLKADFREDKTEDVANVDENAEEYEQANVKGVFTLHPMRVLVSDFTPSPFAVTTNVGGDVFHPDDVMNLESRATLHSGGPYGDAGVRATVTLRGRSFTSQNPMTRDFTFGSALEGADTIQLYQKSAVLDGKGEWTEKFTVPQQNIYFGKLEVESAVQDDRGKSIASLVQADYIGVDRFVGLKSPEWFYEANAPVTLQTVVAGEDGTPLPGTAVNVLVEYEEISVAKVKGSGNAYLSDVTREWKQTADCHSTSEAEPQDCAFIPKSAGTYRVTATINDTKGRAHSTQIMLWVAGPEYVQWADEEKFSLPIVPEKSEYKVGDTAKFLVKNPYPGAQALITIERYGIIERFVKKLEGSAPVIEIPVKPDYLPGFYLSVVVVSPRVAGEVPPVGQIDMAKPSFRMGYVTVPVRDPYKEMTVEVTPEAQVYSPRDKVKIDLVAAAHHPDEGKAQPIELAVAVLDESVFDLISEGRGAFDPYEGFYGLDALDMRNYSLIYRLMGRQKFEKKGANPGGDGGSGMDMRNLFKYVSYWDPSIKTDENGKAQIEFDAPDNLTGWRVLAVATTPTDRVGLGEGEFKVNRPTELRPVMPNQVHEGDIFMAGFSVMNRTDAARTITVEIKASGSVDGDAPIKQETVTLEPYKRSTVYIPLKAALLPIDDKVPQGKISFSATAEDDIDADGVEFSLSVLKKRVTEVAANYGTTIEDTIKENIAFPANIYTDTGEVSVVLSPSVIANLAGAFRYIRDYPYPCWEQVLTRGVMAAHYTQLKAYLPSSLIWEEAKDLPVKTLESAANYQAPNGGMSYFVPTDERADPYLSAYTAIAFHWMKQDGLTVSTEVERKLHQYLLNFLRQDAAPDFYQPGMKSTVRAVALAALAQEGKIDAAEIKRYKPHLKDMSLFGKAHFLQAALLFDDTKDAAKEAADMIFAAGNETGGKFMFSETLDDGYERILATPLRDNCAILSAFMSYASKSGKEIIGDKPFKLVRMITQTRGNRDYWENTQENMFCMNALSDYARAYESVKPKMTITAKMDDTEFGKTSFADVRDLPVTLERPITQEDEGKTMALSLDRKGDGRMYYAARLRYAPKTGWENAVNSGMEISREYSVLRDGKWALLKSPFKVSRGENVRVDLYLSLPAPRNYVVVNDPLPGGLETVNRDLKTASSVDDAQAEYDREGGSMWFKYGDWTEYQFSFWSFYHRELRHDSARFYADRLGAGNYHLSYMTQAIADGEFAALPVRAEEMYDPDVYGRGDNATFRIGAE